MKLDYVLGVRPLLCSQEPTGELVHGTGYHDRTGHWKNGSRWVRRYPDAKVHNSMSRHVLRARDAFHVLRSMPSDGYSFDPDDVRAQAVTALMRTLNWLNA